MDSNDTTESRWFKILSFVAVAFFAILFLINIIYFEKSRRRTLTIGEATSMLWLNVVLFIVAMILFFWTLYRLILSPEYREHIQTTAVTGVKSYVTAPGGFGTVPTTAPVVHTTAPVVHTAAPIGTHTSTSNAVGSTHHVTNTAGTHTSVNTGAGSTHITAPRGVLRQPGSRAVTFNEGANRRITSKTVSVN